MSQQLTKMPILGQIGSFLGKKSFFYWRNQKFCYPHNGKPTQALCSNLFLVGHWTKCAKNGNIWPKMTKNADFGPNLAVFGPKILIFMGYQHNRKPLRQLVRIVFWSGLRSIRPKMPIFGPKCQFLAKFGRFWAKSNFLGAGGKILVPSYQDSNETPFSC